MLRGGQKVTEYVAMWGAKVVLYNIKWQPHSW